MTEAMKKAKERKKELIQLILDYQSYNQYKRSELEVLSLRTLEHIWEKLV